MKETKEAFSHRRFVRTDPFFSGSTTNHTVHLAIIFSPCIRRIATVYTCIVARIYIHIRYFHLSDIASRTVFTLKQFFSRVLSGLLALFGAVDRNIIFGHFGATAPFHSTAVYGPCANLGGYQTGIRGFSGQRRKSTLRV